MATAYPTFVAGEFLSPVGPYGRLRVGGLPAFAADSGAGGIAVPDPLQVARGARAWADNCGRCHYHRDPKEFSDKSWDTIVSQMRVRANLPGQVARDIWYS
jgi:hypothetical protein